MTGFQITISLLVGYFLGCIQSAYLIGKMVRNIDIREHGSANAGASNVTVVMGWKYGVLTATIDILKASVAVILIRNIFPDYPALSFIAGTATIFGHIFPVFLNFRGGKGAASLVGMAIAFEIKIGIILIITLIIVTILSDYIALGTITMFTILPTYLYFSENVWLYTIVGIFFALLAIYKHLPNIQRIIRHEEVGLRSTITNKQTS